MVESNSLFFLFTCVKNGRSYIDKLFNSLLNQTKKNFIHYIYEDGSEEPLDEIAHKYIQKALNADDPFHVIYEKNDINIGLNKATEHCIRKCNSKYFMWMNCDDWLDIHFFEEAEKYIRKNPDCAIYRDTMITHNGNDIRTVPSNRHQKRIFKTNEQLYPCLSYLFTFNHFIANFNLVKNINPSLSLIDDKLVFNDVQICLPFIFLKYKFGYIEKSISHFLYRAESEYNSSEKTFSVDVSKYFTESNNETSKFAHFFELYQRCLKYGNDFLVCLSRKDYSAAIDTLHERKAFLEKHDINNSKVSISERSYFYWLVYCKIKLFLSR